MPTRRTPSAAPRPRRRDCCGGYHFGIGQWSGEAQAAFFLAQSRPGPRTLLALDLEANENNPSNSMTLGQGEAFVARVAEATGRLPVGYVHPTWANGEPLPNSGLRLGAVITPDSILARCGLWVADYHDSPEVPLAWAVSGWRLWQYAGDESAGRPAYGQTSIVQGVSHCDRNLFNGDADALYRFWSANTSRPPRLARFTTAPLLKEIGLKPELTSPLLGLGLRGEPLAGIVDRQKSLGRPAVLAEI